MRSIEHAFEQERIRSMSSPAQSSPVRLTRRGRIVLTALMMIGLVITGFALGHGSSQAAGPVHVVRHTVTVRAGDTLWSLAARVAPHDDPRDVVAEISSLNRLTSPLVEPGEQLVVPSTH
jgi:LysM repeat protein